MNTNNKHSKLSFIHKIITKDISKNTHINLKTRFPPDPNGYLHLGHAKSIYINFSIAKIFHGTCNLRFDDTNPNTNHKKYIQAIKKDIIWLGFKWDQDIKYTSMYFNEIYQYAVNLIKKNLAYVDKLKKHEIRAYRGSLTSPGKNSPYRDQTVEENMLLFKNMKYGNFQEGQVCLRAKIDMTSPFIIMRDPILYRIKFATHHKTQNKWCIYPTYDFAHCVSDALEQITHSLCTLEFQDNRILYNWILNNLGIQHKPRQYEYSRLNLEYSTLSKRALNILINNKIIQNWNDPRVPTISGLKYRGYTASSIRKFCRTIGITKQENTIEISSLENCIRKELNITAYRTMAVIDPIEIIISNLSDTYQENIQILNHPKNPNLGYRKIIFSNKLYIEKTDFQKNTDEKYNRLFLGGTVKLKYAYSITAYAIKKDKNNNINKIFCTCDLRYKKNIKKYGIIHWISQKSAKKSEFRIYNNLFTTKKPNIKKNLFNQINPNSQIIKYGFHEKTITENNNITTYQFERLGYFHIDKKLSKNHTLFHRIVHLKSNWKK